MTSTSIDFLIHDCIIKEKVWTALWCDTGTALCNQIDQKLGTVKKILNKHVESLNQDVIYIQVHIKEIIWNAFCCDAGKAMCWQNWIY